METNFEKGQTLVEMVIVTLALVGFLMVALPQLFVWLDREIQKVSLTREISR